MFFDNRAIPGVTGKAVPRWTGPHKVLNVVNAQQFNLCEEKTGRIFLAHRSRMRKTTREQLAEDSFTETWMRT